MGMKIKKNKGRYTMKFLYVTTVSATFKFLYPHINMLLDQGHKVDLLSNVTREINEDIFERGCHVYNLNLERSPLSPSNFVAIKKIRSIVKNGEYDVIHTHTPVASFLVRLACKDMPDIKIIYTAHGFHFFKGAPIKNWLMYYPIEKIASRWTNGIITINEEDFLLAKKHFSKKANIYKTNGVGINLDKFSLIEENGKIEDKYKDHYVLFYAAELNKNKNQELLIKTIDLVKDIIPNVKLVLAGGGNNVNEYKQLVADLKLENYIEFLGYTTDIPQILKNVDIVVASSKREGLPVNLMEAMVSKVPIIATDNRGHRSLIQDSKNGYLIYNNNINSFKEKIISLYNSPEINSKFVDESYSMITQYTDTVVLSQLNKIYENILN